MASSPPRRLAPRAHAGNLARSAGGARLAGLACALLAVAACGPVRRAERPPVEATSSRVDVYLRATDPSPTPIALDLAGVELLDSAGELRRLDLTRARLVSSDLAQGLQFAGSIVPPAEYTALRLRLRSARMERAGTPVELELSHADEAESPPPEPAGEEGRTYELPLSLRLGRRDAASLFVEWRVSASLPGGLRFLPAFSLTTEKPRAVLGLLYVADAGSSSVLAVDRSSGEVTGTLKVGAGPRALALSRDRRKLFVANAGDGSLTVLDVRLGSAVATVPLGLTAGSWDVALADPDRVVATANREQDSISLVDVIGGVRVVDVSVGRAPLRLAAAQSSRRLFVVGSASDEVHAIDLESRSVVARIATESRPVDCALDRREQELFVAHATSPHLLVFDAAGLGQAASIFVGGDCTAVLADRRRDRIYVARSRPGEIVVVDRRLGAIVRRIPVSGHIESMAQPLDGSLLYGAAPDRGGLIVVDVLLGKEMPAIRCGTRPVDVVVAE